MARNEIDRGWIKGALYGAATSLRGPHQDPSGVCLVGAAYGYKGELRARLQADVPRLGEIVAEGALLAVAKEIGISRGEVVAWNNHPDRTKDEVLAVLDAAAAATAPAPALPDFGTIELAVVG